MTDLIAAMSRATERTTLLAALHRYLQETTQAHEIQVMWLADGVVHALFENQPALRPSTAAEWMQLTAGQIVEASNTTFVPMLVLGDLRGWLAIQPARSDLPLIDVASAAGMTLALLERHAYNGAASRELAMMDKIGRLLSSTLQLDQLLPNLAMVVRELITAQSLYIALIDDETNQLSFAYYSPSPSPEPPDQRWSIDTGLTGLIIRSGAPIVTDDYLSECERRQIQPRIPDGESYSRAWLGVPLRHQDRVLGVMVASSQDPALRYTEVDVHLMSSVAAQAAAAVANAQLYKQVQEQANQLAVINRIGRTISATLDVQEVPMLIMHELKAALDVEDGAVLIEEPGRGDLVVRYTLEPKAGLRVPHRVGLVGEALRVGSVLTVNDMSRDARLYPPMDLLGPIQTRSMICAPLRGRQRLRGVIQLRNKRSGPFTKTDAQLLEAVAEQAAVALENAELYAHTDSALSAHIADLEERNQQLTNIVAISNALRSANNVTEVGEHIVAAVQSLTGSPHVLVAHVEPEQQRVRVVAQVGLSPSYITPRRELWTPVNVVEDLLRHLPQIGTVTYHLGQHELAVGFSDSVVLALLDTGGQLVGMIELDNVDLIAPLSTAMIQELEIIANQASIAIVNARLAGEREQTVDRLTALNALSLAMTTTQLSTDEIMQMTISGAVGTTNGIGGGTYVLGRDGLPRRMVLDLPADSDVPLLPLLNQVHDDFLELSEAEIPGELQAIGVSSLVMVPVSGAKLTLGALWIGYSDTVISPTEREMAVLYAKTAGAVLENLRLFDQVRAAHDRLASILASTTEGMLMATAQGQIAAANEALTRLLGLPAGSLEGRMLEDLCDYPPIANYLEQLRPLYDALAGVARGLCDERGGEINLGDAITHDLAWSVLPVRGTDQEPTAALLVLRDITAERQTEKLRQDLSNMIVHDLRAPLTNMMVSIDLLLKQISGPLTPAQQRIINIAGDSSQQMLDLVNALLDIRRLEQRQLDLQRQPAELFELVESVFERSERIADERRITLNNATTSVPPVSIDVDLMRRILQNLVDNAVKFSPRGGNVTVSGHRASAADLPPNHGDGNWVVVDITDQGQGVPEAYRSVIFELFGQAPQGRGQGTGLGLAFCKLAIAAHGGAVWVEDAPGGGAVFRFTVPLA